MVIGSGIVAVLLQKYLDFQVARAGERFVVRGRVDGSIGTANVPAAQTPNLAIEYVANARSQPRSTSSVRLQGLHL